MAPLRAARPRWWYACELVAFLVLVAMLALLALRPASYQWDLGVYRNAARLVMDGGSPYGTLAGGEETPYEFVYAPLVAYLFAPLALLTPTAARWAWLAMKLLAFAAVVRLWSPLLRPRTPDAATPIPPIYFVTFAFSSTLLVDLVTGNIATLELLLLSLALVGLPRRGYWRFALLVALAAQFKLLPVLLLGLLLVVDEGPRWAPLLGGAAVFGGLLGLDYLARPVEFGVFLQRAGSLGAERGLNNPSTLALSRDVVALLDRHGLELPRDTAFVLYAVALGIVAVVTARWWLGQRRAGTLDSTFLALLAPVVYAIVAPRMKCYSYVLLLPPAWYVLRQPGLDSVPLVTAVVLFPRPMPATPLGRLLWATYEYMPLLAATALWVTMLRLRTGPGGDASPPGPVPSPSPRRADAPASATRPP